MFIIDAIKKIKNSKRLLFTTPTHLQGNIIPDGIKQLIGKKAFETDFSEIDGLDNLKKPEFCILKSQQWAAKIYDTKASFYLTNGSSSGILAIMLTVLKDNDKVLIARNAHESIFNGLVLTGAIPVWFLPEYDKQFDVAKGITLSQIKSEYKKNPDIKAVIITSPTYEGMISEVKEISEFCKSKNIIFIVDEAHGALFPFSNNLPDSAINLGADVCVQSLHKTTPALTGCAILHIGKNSKINPVDIQKNLNLVTTTSPSWLLIASIEAAINFLSGKQAKKEIDLLLGNIEQLKSTNKNFDFLDNDDPTKLVISRQNINGEKLSKFLFENNIEDELVTTTAVLCLCGIGTTQNKIKKLSNVLKKFKTNRIDKIGNTINTIPTMKLKPKDAHFSSSIMVNKKNATGEIIAENITPYPPCIPVLVAGEIIEPQHLKYLPNKVKIIKE